jgi:catechol 2,3-dioxygenase-like lactoylglutathione lyase family enzyme
VALKVILTSIFVDDQEQALTFYTEKLGFVKKMDVVNGDYRWLTVVSSDDPHGVELLLEPAAHPAARPFREAIRNDGIPFTNFGVDSVSAEYARLTGLGVEFTGPPQNYGVWSAVFDDTCGNLIQITGSE